MDSGSGQDETQDEAVSAEAVLAETAQAEAVLAEAVGAYRAAFGSRLVAGYALGSLAHGGFSALVSDVDLGLILSDPLRVTDRLTVGRAVRPVRAGGTDLHRRLSVFWGTPSTLRGQARGGRFPPLDRLDLLEYGRLLTGQDTRDVVARPGRTELLVAGAEFALGSLGGDPGPRGRLRAWAGRPAGEDVLAQVRTPSLLVARGTRPMTKVVLFPVRFLFTAKTGRVGTNALAVEHYLAGDGVPPAEPAAEPVAAELVAAAMAWRREPPGGDQAAALLARDLLPLYLHYLDDHSARLDSAGRPRLAQRFRRWRARLLA